MNSLVNSKFVAIYIILLVLTLPVYSSMVMASHTKEVKIYGADEFSGYLKGSQDTMTIVADIEADSEEVISPDDVEIEFGGAYAGTKFKFSDEFCSGSCNPLTQDPENPNTYRCYCYSQFTLSGQKQTTATVSYKGSSKTSSVTRDDLPPTISKAEISQEDGKLKLTYDVTDKSCSGCEGKCTGLKNIKIYDEDGWSYSEDMNVDDCRAVGTLDMDYTKDGEQNFYIKFMDGFWSGFDDDNTHSSENQVEFTTDFTPPQLSSNFDFFKDKNPINYISSTGIQGDLVTYIKDDYLKTVTLGAAYGNNEESISACPKTSSSCTGCVYDDTLSQYNCTFKNKKILLPDGETTASFDLTVENEGGNIVTQTITKSFSEDSSKPLVTYFGSKGYDPVAQLSYIKAKDNTLVMQITEPDSGFNLKDVYLNLASINNKNNVQATNCSTDGTTWQCVWDKVDVTGISGKLYTISRLGSSTDDAENNFENSLNSVNLQLDTNPPKKPKFDIKSMADVGLIDFHKSGDILQITANISDYISPSDTGSGISIAYANFSKLLGHDLDTGNVSGTCTASGNISTCVWETQPITTGYKELKVPFTFVDYAGNKAKYNANITIYNPLENDIPNCYNLKILDLPAVEYTMIKYLGGNYYYTVPFKLTTNNCRGSLYELQLLGDCADGAGLYFGDVKKDTDVSGFIQFPLVPADISKIYEQSGGYNHKAKFTIGVKEGNSCALAFFVTSGVNSYNIPEIENISVEIPIVNELVPAGDNVINEIKDIVDNDAVTGAKLAKAEKVMAVARNICNTKNVFDTVIETFVTVRFIFQPIADGPIPGAKAVAKATSEALGGVMKFFNIVEDGLVIKFFGAFCGMVTCTNNLNETNDGTNDLIPTNVKGYKIPGGFLPILYKWVKTGYEAICPTKPQGSKCKFLTDLFKDNSIQEADKAFGSSFPASPMELAKQSEIIAYTSLCIPAVLYHWNKHKQLECWKGYSYAKLIPLGIPKFEIDKQYGYQKCVARTGWLNALIKLIGFDRIGKVIANIIKDPYILAWPLAKRGLSGACNAAQNLPLQLVTCIPIRLINAVEHSLTAWDTVKNYIKGFDWKNLGQPDYCSQLTDFVVNNTVFNTTTTTTTDDSLDDITLENGY